MSVFISNGFNSITGITGGGGTTIVSTGITGNGGGGIIVSTGSFITITVSIGFGITITVSFGTGVIITGLSGLQPKKSNVINIAVINLMLFN